MAISSEDLLRAVFTAWPQSFLAEHGCAWVVNRLGDPVLDASGTIPSMILRSLVWETTLTVPLVRFSEIVQHSSPYYAGREMRKRIEDAVRELQEAPPFWVEPDSVVFRGVRYEGEAP